ncbi:MAG: hypothetical protein ACLP8A_03920 [Methylovirgula sp.]
MKRSLILAGFGALCILGSQTAGALADASHSASAQNWIDQLGRGDGPDYTYGAYSAVPTDQFGMGVHSEDLVSRERRAQQRGFPAGGAPAQDFIDSFN